MSSETNAILRNAEAEDAPRARAVRWAAGWTDPPAQHRTWLEADNDWQTNHYFREIVAEVEGVIAARIGLEAFRPPFAELIDLCVRPEYRRRGLGEQLTLAGMREAARRGFAAVFLQTEIDNHAAHRLYTDLGFVPTAHGKMLRMLKFLDYPLLTSFQQDHPLNQYACSPVSGEERAWNLEWNAYVTADYLRLRLEGGASRTDSEGMGPAITAFDWRVEQGARGLRVRIEQEKMRDIEPGNHVEFTVTLRNYGKRLEAGSFEMLLPPGVRVSGPETNITRVFQWQAGPGEEIRQPIVVQIEPEFDASALWHLNYGSLPVCMETYWEGQRGLLSVSLPMAVPPPHE